jgi:hypothetical protein
MRYVTIAVLLCAAYLIGRVTPPDELQQAYTHAEITSIERHTAIQAALAPIDVAYGSLWRLVPLAAVVSIAVWACGLLWIDLVNSWAARRQ